jgi:hypothetical protein
MAFLEGLTAVDLGLDFQNGQHFAAYQDMSEEKSQEITYQGAFGTDGPVLRRKRKADTGTLTFTAILLKAGAAAGMNNMKTMESMEDFQAQAKTGGEITTYLNCDWTRLTKRSTIDQVSLDADISIPGYAGPKK